MSTALRIRCLNCGLTHAAVYAVDLCWESRPEYGAYQAAADTGADTYDGHPGHLVGRRELPDVLAALAEANNPGALDRGFGTVKFDYEEMVPALHLEQAVLIAEAIR